MKKHIYEYDEVVVGGSMNALTYAFVHGLPIVALKFKEPPLNFVIPETNIVLKKVGYNNSTYARYVWTRMLSIMTFAGLMPLSSYSKTARVDVEKKILAINTSYNKVIKIRYGKLTIFDADELNGVSIQPLEDETKEMYDYYFPKNRITEQNISFEVDDSYIKRIDVLKFTKNKNLNNIFCVTSRVKKSEDDGMSDVIYTTLKTRKILKHKLNSMINIVHLERKVYDRTKYETLEGDSISFNNSTFEEICDTDEINKKVELQCQKLFQLSALYRWSPKQII